MADMAPTQGRYLAYIHEYTRGFGLPPAEAEIAAALGVSPPSVNQMVKTLEKKGFIQRLPGVPRSIKILVPPDTIPKWKGKRITRTTREWTFTGMPKLIHQLAKALEEINNTSTTTTTRDITSKQSGKSSSATKSTIYRFKITLQHTDPPIWRRIETQDITLEEFHVLIQTAMGWTDSHLHQFVIAKVTYVDPDSFEDGFGDVDYTDVQISDLVARHGTKLRMRYDYDFGDSWHHAVALEKVTETQPGVKYPRCTAGARACPPEDIGGVYGYEDFVEAITNPNHSEHADALEWGGPYHPENFDPTTATQHMQNAWTT